MDPLIGDLVVDGVLLQAQYIVSIFTCTSIIICSVTVLYNCYKTGNHKTCILGYQSGASCSKYH